MNGPEATPPPGAVLDDAGLACLVALSHLEGLGPATLLRCLRDDGPQAVWHAVVAGRAGRVEALREVLIRRGPAFSGTLRRAALSRDPEADLAAQRAGGRRVLPFGAPDYPRRLFHDPAPPALLYAMGDVGVPDGPAVAVVGTRNATRPGLDLANELGAGLAQAGVAVVSGLAVGIDGAAHQGALAGDPRPGRPVAVVGCGLDVVYPRRHGALHRQVAARGVLLSECPLGVRPSRWRFPARNRIIAGLADAGVVVESRATGGSMLTAGDALDRGIPVLAVPGHPHAPASAGTNELLFDGATLVRDARDVLDAIGVAPVAGVGDPTAAARPDPHLRPVWELLATGALALPEVVVRSGLPFEDAAAALTVLEAEGWVVRTGSWYEARRRSGGQP